MHVSEYSQYTPSHHTTAATRSHKPTTNVGNEDLACRWPGSIDLCYNVHNWETNRLCRDAES